VYELFESKFKNADELYDRLVNKWYDYWLAYKGNEYLLSWYREDSALTFSIGRTWLDEAPSQYGTFDELLDNFCEGGKSLREFAPDIEELRRALVTEKASCDVAYNGKVYFLCRYPQKGRIVFVIYTNPDFDSYDLENNFKSDSFDGLLNNFKVDGKSLREFIFEADVKAVEYDAALHEHIH